MSYAAWKERSGEGKCVWVLLLCAAGVAVGVLNNFVLKYLLRGSPVYLLTCFLSDSTLYLPWVIPGFLWLDGKRTALLESTRKIRALALYAFGILIAVVAITQVQRRLCPFECCCEYYHGLHGLSVVTLHANPYRKVPCVLYGTANSHRDACP